ncbi:hypothetical protein [Methanolobus tindarius]|nr:hypothetical protein [Methanolobus tindarius]
MKSMDAGFVVMCCHCMQCRWRVVIVVSVHSNDTDRLTGSLIAIIS